MSASPAGCRRSSRGSPARRLQRGVRVAVPQRPGDRVSRVPTVNTSVDVGRRAHRRMGEPDQRVRVRRHRARDIDEQHEPAWSGPPGSSRQPGRLAAVAQHLPHGPRRVHRAAPGRTVPAAAAGAGAGARSASSRRTSSRSVALSVSSSRCRSTSTSLALESSLVSPSSGVAGAVDAERHGEPALHRLCGGARPERRRPEVRGERGVVGGQVVRLSTERQPAGPVDAGAAATSRASAAASIAGTRSGLAGTPACRSVRAKPSSTSVTSRVG